MPNPLQNAHVALGVTGSIACYKAVDLASKLTQGGALVDVVMTRGAMSFLAPLTFRSITHREVVTNVFDPSSELSMDHVAIAQRADVVLIAPATANTIAKLAHGLADDALTTTVLATAAPVIIAPAMDAHMFDNAATQENVRVLESRGVVIAGPAEGRLASGITGKGRMLEPEALIGYLRMVLGHGGDLAGRKVVVSAGGTQEPIDPVRVITNRSSGKMGFAIAEAARDRGATVVIVTAPTALPDPVGVDVIRVETALQMKEAIVYACADADALVMAAAVADWRSVSEATSKIQKGASDTWSVELTKNPDILASIEQAGLVKVGFAAESEDLMANAQAKLLSKGLDLIAANDITAPEGGFASDDNKVILLDREGAVDELPLMSKYEVGHRILDRIVGIMP